MPFSVCLHHHLSSRLTKFCDPFKSIHSSSDSSLFNHPSIMHSHSFLTSIPWLTSVHLYLSIHLFLLFLLKSLPSLSLFHSICWFLLPASFYMPPTFPLFFSTLLHLSSSFSSHLCWLPWALNLFFLSFPLSTTSHLSCSSLPSLSPSSPHLALILSAFLFYSLGEFDCSWFLPITSQASPEMKKAPVKDYEADP